MNRARLKIKGYLSKHNTMLAALQRLPSLRLLAAMPASDRIYKIISMLIIQTIDKAQYYLADPYRIGPAEMLTCNVKCIAARLS
jgi:hypothetical protein